MREMFDSYKGGDCMKIENEFVVDAPVQQAWDAMLDLERIAPCLPGASIDEAADEEYQGTMAIRLGPISARYRGTVNVEEADEENYRAVLKANGNETRGQGSASATITSTLYEENGSTRVHVETDMQVAGRVAQFGRGIMQDVAEEMMDRFSTCVEQEIVGGGADKEAEEPSKADAPEQEPATAAEGPSTSAQQEEAKTGKVSPREVEPLDLGDISRGALAKRAAPVLAGLGGLGLAVILMRFLWRPSFSVKFEIRKH
jgi:carbon monoxide dehydrogenase subunit G